MDQVLEFFKKLFDTSDWPPRWHCGNWTDFHGWLYIISDLLIWSAYFAIPVVIVKFISKKVDTRFLRTYVLFAAFILACGSTHLLDAITFWFPAYRLNALVRAITGVISWITVFHLIKKLPLALKLRSNEELEKEVNERKQAEENLRVSNALLNEAQEIAKMGHWQWDLKTDKLFWSESMYKIFGIQDSTKPLSFNDFISRVHPEDRNFVEQKLQEALAKKIFPSFTHRTLLDDGSMHNMQARGEVVLDEKGDVIRMIGTGQDITEQVRAQQDLLDKTEQLELTNSELQRFAYVASHDLQEPLRKIRTFASLLEKEKNDFSDKSGFFLEKITNSASRMQKLIDDILQFSSLKANPSTFEKTDLNVLLKYVLSDMEVKIEEARAEIQIDKLPAIEVIPSQIGQLFQNLISNAIKFHQPGKAPLIKISSAIENASDGNEMEDLSKKMVRISVEDNGIGFDEMYKEKIFEIFQRLHASKIYSGTGIGLAICKKIVDTHQGKIDVESKPGIGTKFTIWLPLVQQAIVNLKKPN